MLLTIAGVRRQGLELKDFKTFNRQLYPAEQRLLNGSGNWNADTFLDERPNRTPDLDGQPTIDTIVRGAFLRFLALSPGTHVAQRGLLVDNVHIVASSNIDIDSPNGTMSFRGARIPRPMIFDWCVIHGALDLRDAQCSTVALLGCRLESIEADRVRIEGSLHLNQGTVIKGPVRLRDARIDAFLTFEGSTIEVGAGMKDEFALACDNARIAGDVALRNGFGANACVRFCGAEIGGSLICDGGRFGGAAGTALICDDVRVARSVKLGKADGSRRRFIAKGTVSFVRARIGGGLDCRGACIEAPAAAPAAAATAPAASNSRRPPALDVASAEIGGAVELGCKRDIEDSHFVADGCVDFGGAIVRGDFDCDGGLFQNMVLRRQTRAYDFPPPPRADLALSLRGARIEGTLTLGGRPASWGRCRKQFFGSISLQSAYARELRDHSNAWPDDTVVGLLCAISLDGFVYERFAGDGDYDAGNRRRWLDRQPPEHRGRVFDPKEKRWVGGLRPQPLEQIVKVLNASGYEEDARQLAMTKGHRQSRALLSRSLEDMTPYVGIVRRLAVMLAILLSLRYYLPGADWIILIAILCAALIPRPLVEASKWFLIGCIAGYGYGRKRLLLGLLLLWLLPAWVYCHAKEQGVFGPSSPGVYLSSEMQARSECYRMTSDGLYRNWSKEYPEDHRCRPPIELGSLNALAYSADVMLPVVDLGQERNWTPLSRPLALPLPGGFLALGKDTLEIIVWIQGLLGWVMIGLTIAVLSGVIRRD